MPRVHHNDPNINVLYHSPVRFEHTQTFEKECGVLKSNKCSETAEGCLPDDIDEEHQARPTRNQVEQGIKYNSFLENFAPN